MAENTQTQQQINTLRTLQLSYNALADAQSAQATATALEAAKQAILNAIAAIDTSDLAKEATLGDVQDVLEYIEQGGMPSITAIAKQGSNANATLSDTQAAVVDGNDTAISVSKEVRSEVGTSSDTASETGTTLFAVLKWVKDKVKSIFDYIGTPASGQPATLFAAIAQGSGGVEFVVVDNSVLSQELEPNKIYVFTGRSNNLTLTFSNGYTASDEFHLFIEVNDTLPTITFPNTISWAVSGLKLKTYKSTEISILNDIAVWC